MKLKKGSAAAKAYMAKIRGKRKSVSGLLGVRKKGHKTAVYYDRVKPHPKIRIGKPTSSKFTKSSLKSTMGQQALTLPGGHGLLHRRITGLFDIAAIKEIDDLKKQYHQLAKKYHPDTGGTKEQFQKLQKEYDAIFKQILSGSELSAEQKKNEIVLDDAMRAVVDSIISIPDISIELSGKWLWITGNTYPYRKELKLAGLQFAPVKKVWYFAGTKSAGRGGMDLEEIRSKYGSSQIKPSGNKLISGINLSPSKKAKLKSNLCKIIRALKKRII